MLSEERKKIVLEVGKKLIRTRSYSGEEQKIVAIMEDYAKENGYDEVETDRYGNCILRVLGNRPGPVVLFDAHMDTVPVPDADRPLWKHDPFAAEIDGGRMYGRGTSDMKSALAGMLAGVGFFIEDTKKDFAGEICIAGIVHEECFEGVAAREVSTNIRPDYVIIGESSELDLKIGQRGRAEIVVETFGTPAHSSNPEKGNNAVYAMTRIIEAIRALPVTEHPMLGKGILELTDIKSSPYPGASVVPDYCKATYDRRLLVGETKESVLSPIRDILSRLMAEDSSIHAEVSYAKGEEVCYTGETICGERFFPAWLYDADEPYVRKIEAVCRASGYEPKIRAYSFCTNGSHYAGEAGIKTIGLGPSRENLAHTIDEYVELSQLYGAAECYGLICRALNQG